MTGGQTHTTKLEDLTVYMGLAQTEDEAYQYLTGSNNIGKN